MGEVDYWRMREGKQEDDKDEMVEQTVEAKVNMKRWVN
jgi:hypothetical protein